MDNESDLNKVYEDLDDAEEEKTVSVQVAELKEKFRNNRDHLKFISDMYSHYFELRAYSGRGMYGRECPAVVCETDQLQDIIRATDIKLVWDSMGYDLVVYPKR